MEYMESKMQDQIEGGHQTYKSMSDELERCRDLLAWSYTKLHRLTFSSVDDALKLDDIKLLLEHGL